MSSLWYHSYKFDKFYFYFHHENSMWDIFPLMFWEHVSHFDMNTVFATVVIPNIKIRQPWDCLYNGYSNTEKMVFMLKWSQSLKMTHKKPIPFSQNSQKSSIANNPIWKTIEQCGITFHIPSQWAPILQLWNGICYSCYEYMTGVNTLRPSHNGRRFADDTFKRIFLNENVRIPIEISLKFVPKGPINNIPTLVQIMAWHRPGDKPLSAPMMVSLLTHICVTRPQWVYHGDAEFILGNMKINIWAFSCKLRWWT